MMNYKQIAPLINQGLDIEMIEALTGASKDDIKLIKDNVMIESKMRSCGSQRFHARQDAIKASGRVMDSEVTMALVRERLKPMGRAIEAYCDAMDSQRGRSTIAEVLKKHDPMMLALSTIRIVILGITTDKTSLTALSTRLVNTFDKTLDVPTQVRVGWKLVSLLCKHCDEHFVIELKGNGRHAVNCVTATEAFYEWEDLNENIMAEMAVMYRPMVVPPQPWTSLHSGGYWDAKLEQPFIRNNPKATNESHGPKTIPLVYKAVNKTQATRFTVNKFVLNVVNELTETEACFKGFLEDLPERPHNEKTKALKETIEECEKALGITLEAREEQGKGFGVWVKDLLHRITGGDEHKIKVKLEEARFKLVQYIKWRKAVTSIKSKNRVLVTAREVANDYSMFDVIYFPHNLDWRGRMYPLCSGLTTQGVCMQKALLKFAEGKPIGSKEALYWLMVHTANSYGCDKLSIQDRIKWTAMNKDIIVKVADDPIANLELWSHTDDPWLFLAACEQMCKYYKDGLKAVVDIAIPVDGTTNGSQHYAAMMKDEKAAMQNNVAPIGTEGLAERLRILRLKDKTDTVGSVKPYSLLTTSRNDKMKKVIGL
jgi:hypothetical protein